MPQFDSHSRDVKVWGCPQALQRGPIVLKFALCSREDACALLTPQPLHMLPFNSPRVSPLLHQPPTLLLLLPPLLLVFFLPEARATTGNNGRSHSYSHGQPCPGLADSTTLHGSVAKPKLTWGGEGRGGGGRRGGGGDGFKGRRHLVSPRRVSVCPERGCMIDQREEGKKHFGYWLFFPASLAACLVVLLCGVYS